MPASQTTPASRTTPARRVEEMQALHVLCRFCASALYEKPTAEMIAAYAQQADLFLGEPFTSAAPEPGRALHVLFSAAGQPEEGEALLQELGQDYTYLFLMVGSSRTSPYESVYRTDDRTLFGPTTVQVRKAYEAAGVELASSEHEPDDHIGLEFAFLAHLLGGMSEALQEGDQERLGAAEAQLRAFAQDHLLVFSDAYLYNLTRQAQSLYYQSVARVCSNTIALLSQEFDMGPVTSVGRESLL
ncbi:MAG: molecular chaperone TorD family protein [Coriobacteriaceae bacterium]|jgi:TorA maturation chaperone TorD|nr:molecular chaperone TorD family protein [Coriobacteriaceae bacterium]